jgi:hypothetical protein
MRSISRFAQHVAAFAAAIVLLTNGPAKADQPPHVEMLGNNGCLLVFDMSTHENPSAMFRYIRENSEGFVGEANQNIAQWLANFPEFRGNVGTLIKRNCKTFIIEISDALPVVSGPAARV